MEIDGSGGERRITVYEGDDVALAVTSSRRVLPGVRLCVGREGDLLIGMQPVNLGISRRAVYVTAMPSGWRIEVRNRGGAYLHPWAQPSLAATTDDTLSWPLVGVRLLHESEGSQHWVLLSADDLPVTPAGPTSSVPSPVATRGGDRPRPLSRGQREALAVVFGELLCWPPRHPATPLLLKQAARRIGISGSALQGRLAEAWNKAVELGLPGSTRELTDPDYFYALVRGGYIESPVDGAVVRSGS